jgi:uncharacterized protein (TIGR00299 family) protein
VKIAYLDCSAGISGNMFLGALLDFGLPQDYLLAELGKLGLELPEISIERVKRQGITATLVEVPHCEEKHHRHLENIASLICSTNLKNRIKEKAIKCFQNLAAAEAKIHGTSIEEIHFHEVGAIDAIIDIVGAAIALDYFNFDAIFTSSIRVGYGSIICAHGEIPLPAPATLELIKGFNIFEGELSGEWTTPTGAAILKTFTQQTLSIPSYVLKGVGYGAGTDQRAISNVLRLIVGDAQKRFCKIEEQLVIETNIDDMNPEILGYLGDKLLNYGVKDYFYTPIYMKKNRPAIKLTIILEPQLAARVEKLLFTETTTLGVRKYLVQRDCMERSEVLVKIDHNYIRVKTGLIDGKIVKFAPEYEDCLALAKQSGKTLHSIYEKTVFQAKQVLELKD